MYLTAEIEMLSHCTLCPRCCGVNRMLGETGYCRSDALFRVASVCVHKGEEDVISGKKGICNVFFPHCNLQCVFCQNSEISLNTDDNLPEPTDYDELVASICAVLDTTENIVGFVSPSHYIPQVMAIIRGICKTGRKPVFVYNTNAYDSVESLKKLEGIIDVYLPDFKYMDATMASEYSQALYYPEVALAAIREMFRQKGASLIVDENGLAVSGIIVRHLVLPEATAQSIEVLKSIANEVSQKLHISLMSQYFPVERVHNHRVLNRCIIEQEYRLVINAMEGLGFYRGWVQDLESAEVYLPKFSLENPFDDKALFFIAHPK